MRENLPITHHEFILENGRPIVSKTDLKGNILYVNPYFVEVSGYTEAELLGAPHNLVRHPDMPPDAFKDLWATLKAKEMWSALVKNRRKNGDFYWVKANVAPTVENGEVTGYISVRTKPTRDEITAAETLYRDMREGRAKRLKILRGHVVRTGIANIFDQIRHASIEKRIACTAIFQMIILASLGAYFITTADQSAGVSPLPLAAIAVGMAAMATQWFSLHRRVMLPLIDAVNTVKRIAGGDLSLSLQATRRDEVGRLLQGVQQMNVTLVSLIGDVMNNVNSMTHATKEIAAGNMDLSSRTEQQASSLEQSASTMEEFAATIRQNADNSLKAQSLARSAHSVTGEGRKKVDHLGTTMTDIVQSSRQIRDIVTLIDGIAFQTNILALNAAVEAARAGEHGRGFAVVATEVRTLAQRSAAAAKEIGNLISTSVESVRAGERMVQETQGMMQKIAESVKDVDVIISEIALAGNEQATGIQQVNQAISHMDEVTQQNAALVEEAAAASSNLYDQSNQLREAISLFNISRK
ncbi:PAS domain-containing methyl-accepting chemotaxis protein [Janthinobacterium sp. 17J80-10]|uniref:methyl-accepting chemotaxis protein n=1 Tax=Janthinobacterium sp. 17J80-10 TaxID=2497863 RepID=UPI001005912C|nr:PAS domain-containing methyl-accepting chemotaxis protein [Janthinobacterium sp. 17J80-10]QAU33098.1 PAS domain S-box protein [Janthinobacterium sp. 17J80-10]